jgi:hypothetical protein
MKGVVAAVGCTRGARKPLRWRFFRKDAHRVASTDKSGLSMDGDWERHRLFRSPLQRRDQLPSAGIIIPQVAAILYDPGREVHD